MTRPLRKRISTCLTLLFVSAHFVFAAASPAFAEPKPSTKPAPAAEPRDLVAKGQQLFDDQQYEDSIQTLSAALLRPTNTKDQRVEIYRLLALNYITLGRKDEADSAVRGLLVVQPGYQLPETESPRFRDFFAQARSKWEAEGRPGITHETPVARPTTLRHRSPSSAERNKAIDLRGKLDDPDERTSRVTLYYRAGSQGDFNAASAEIEGTATARTVHAQIPAAEVKPPVMDYYFEILDGSGAVIASRGDAQSPLRVAIPDGSGSGWVLPMAIGGGVLGAAAIVGGLALAGVFKSSSPSTGGRGNANVNVNVGEAGLRF